MRIGTGRFADRVMMDGASAAENLLQRVVSKLGQLNAEFAARVVALFDASSRKRMYYDAAAVLITPCGLIVAIWWLEIAQHKP